MNIVKLVILFCDHCVLLCNMCKMFGTPPPRSVKLVLPGRFGSGGGPVAVKSSRWSSSVPSLWFSHGRHQETMWIKALWMSTDWVLSSPARSGAAQSPPTLLLVCKCLKTDALINKVPSVSAGISVASPPISRQQSSILMCGAMESSPPWTGESVNQWVTFPANSKRSHRLPALPPY